MKKKTKKKKKKKENNKKNMNNNPHNRFPPLASSTVLPVTEVHVYFLIKQRSREENLTNSGTIKGLKLERKLYKTCTACSRPVWGSNPQ